LQGSPEQSYGADGREVRRMGEQPGQRRQDNHADQEKRAEIHGLASVVSIVRFG
jgi:hypothetical protein